MKEFICPKKGCGSKQFVLTTTKQTLVDFTQEGAIEGHPHLEHISTSTGTIFCCECQARLPLNMTKEMLKEII